MLPSRWCASNVKLSGKRSIATGLVEHSSLSGMHKLEAARNLPTCLEPTIEQLSAMLRPKPRSESGLSDLARRSGVGP